jgi:hypothetical protein
MPSNRCLTAAQPLPNRQVAAGELPPEALDALAEEDEAAFADVETELLMPDDDLDAE